MSSSLTIVLFPIHLPIYCGMCQTIPYNVYLYLIIMITNTYVKVYKENAQKSMQYLHI